MSKQESLRPHQQLDLIFRSNVPPKKFASTALEVRSLYAQALSEAKKQQVPEDETGLAMKKIEKLELEESGDIEAGTRLVFIAPPDANPQILQGVRDHYTKKDA